MAGKRVLAGVLAAISLLFTACGAAPAAEAAETEETFSVDILSTGKSDCALIRLDDLVILSDTADADDFPAICALLKSYGVERIDYIILSHYDKDHIGSTAALVRAYPVGEILAPDYWEPSLEFAEIQAACDETKTPWTRLTEDRLVETQNGSILADPPDRDYGDDNNNSLLTTVTWKGRRLLFLGDAKKKRMEEFLTAAESAYDFIKLPHHGDSCKPLLRLLRESPPEWAVETVSAFEAVEPELISTLESVGTELFLTRDGPVSVIWDGENFTVIQK